MNRRLGRSVLPWLVTLAAAGLALHRLAWLWQQTGGVWAWDFAVYGAAGRAFAGENPYLPYHVGTGFFNHPIAILLAAPFGAAGLSGRMAWTLLIGLLWVGLWLAASRRAGSTTPSLLPLLFWTPAIEAIFMGQVSLPAAACLLAGLELDRRGRPVPAGIALAGAVLLKASLAVFLILFAARRKWRLLLWTVLTMAFLTLLCEAVLYRGVTLDFLASLQTTAGSVHVSAQNASFTPHLGRAAAAAGGLLIGTLAWTAARRRSEQPVGRSAGGFAAASLLFSPLTWHHHFLWLVGPLADRLRRGGLAGWGLFFLVQADLLGQLLGLPVHLAAVCALGFALLALRPADRSQLSD